MDFCFNIIFSYGVVLHFYLKRFRFSHKFPFHCHVQVFSCAISSICRLKYQFACFSSHFYFLVLIVFMPGLILQMLILAFFVLFNVTFESFINIFTQSLILVSPVPLSFLETPSLSMSFLGYKALCIVINFPVLWSICMSSFSCPCYCGPLLVTVPNVVWLLLTVFVVAVVFVTITFTPDCLLCQVLPCLRCLWKIQVGLTQISRIFFRQSGDTSA